MYPRGARITYSRSVFQGDYASPMTTLHAPYTASYSHNYQKRRALPIINISSATNVRGNNVKVV